MLQSAIVLLPQRHYHANDLLLYLCIIFVARTIILFVTFVRVINQKMHNGIKTAVKMKV